MTPFALRLASWSSRPSSRPLMSSFVSPSRGERWTSTGESDSLIGQPEHRDVEAVDVGDVTQRLARDVPAGSLQFDHVGAHPGQHLSARRSRLHMRHVQDTHAFECLSHDIPLLVHRVVHDSRRVHVGVEPQVDQVTTACPDSRASALTDYRILHTIRLNVNATTWLSRRFTPIHAGDSHKHPYLGAWLRSRGDS